jgi:hypothetical protein
MTQETEKTARYPGRGDTPRTSPADCGTRALASLVPSVPRPSRESLAPAGRSFPRADRTTSISERRTGTKPLSPPRGQKES